MQAVSYDRFGGPEVLRLVNMPSPVPGKGQVLVRVRASSINVIDSRVRKGMMGVLAGKKFPRTPGADLAGTVEAVGPGVQRFAAGDRVYGAVAPFKGGAMAEYALVPTGQLARMPAGLGFAEAAALPVAAVAALYSLRNLGQVQPGSQVLIHGASGPVGLYALQMARTMGVHVTAVAGRGGMDLAREFGAETVFDYRGDLSALKGRHFDLILNASGAMPWANGRRLLAPSGRLIEPSPTIPLVLSSPLVNLFRSRKHLPLTSVPRTPDLDALTAMVDAGTLRAIIAAEYPLAEARIAFEDAERGGSTGKRVVVI
jgi:NADPH:quinone reductase-like Zn-dependent oxidoreductase